MYTFIKIKDSFKDKWKQTVEMFVNQMNSWLDKYGFAIELVDETDFEEEMEDCVAMFLASIQDCADIFPICINYNLMNEICLEENMSESEMTYELKMSVAHECGHGIYKFLYDFNEFDLPEDEEYCVEDFADSYCNNSLNSNALFKELKKYSEQ